VPQAGPKKTGKPDRKRAYQGPFAKNKKEKEIKGEVSGFNDEGSQTTRGGGGKRRRKGQFKRTSFWKKRAKNKKIPLEGGKGYGPIMGNNLKWRAREKKQIKGEKRGVYGLLWGIYKGWSPGGELSCLLAVAEWRMEHQSSSVGGGRGTAERKKRGEKNLIYSKKKKEKMWPV